MGMKQVKDILSSILIFAIFISILFINEITDYIPDNNISRTVFIIIVVVVFILNIYDIYNEIRKKMYTTTTFIVILEIIRILNYVFIFYILYDKAKDIDSLLLQNRIYTIGLLVQISVSMLLSYMRSEKFKKELV